jgi:hypothetical protein
VIGTQDITSNNSNAFTVMQPLSEGLTSEAWELSNKMVLSLTPQPNCVFMYSSWKAKLLELHKQGQIIVVCFY